MRVQGIADAVDALAPRRFAEGWDNVGLLLGDPAAEVSRVLLALDVRDSTVALAVNGGYNVIVAHHPLIFKPLKSLRADTPLGRKLAALLAHGIAVIAAHTNLDTAPGGVNDVLADRLGLDPDTCAPLAAKHDPWLKLAVFVPAEHAERVRRALFDAGAGRLGKYSEASFSVSGRGTFKPQVGAQPFLGAVGERATVEEERLEVILPAVRERAVVRALLAAHPYEMPAFDLCALRNTSPLTDYGLGRVGRLPQPVSLATFVERVRESLSTPVRVAASRPLDAVRVRTVGLCGGSGAEFIDAAKFAGCDVYVTGDVRYHEAQHACELGLPVVDAGHFATEQPVVPVLANRLRELLDDDRLVLDVEPDTRDFFALHP